MERRNVWMTMMLLSLVAVALPIRAGAKPSCNELTARRVERFDRLMRRDITRCERRAARRGAACPDARMTRRVDRREARTVRAVERHCPSSDVAAQLATVESALLCTELDVCASFRSLTVRVTDGSSSSAARNTGGASRMLDVDVGWTGHAHNLQILEGAAYEAELSNCDGTSDTSCDLHGAVAGTPFGAPSPISAGGVSTCVTIDFASDVSGSFNLATGELSATADIDVGVYLGPQMASPCPFCLTEGGAPMLGDTGTCTGGPNAGATCVVDALADAGFVAGRATSHDCPPDPATQLARFSTVLSAATGTVALATSSDSPNCTAFGFTNVKCPCGTCNNGEATPCASDADCPLQGGLSGVCGASSSGEPTKPNACTDAVCTPTPDGGRCLSGPSYGRCSFTRFASCRQDSDCPSAGELCEFAPAECFPDPIELQGTPAPPIGNVAKPTLVGASCLGTANSVPVNIAVGLPGPVSYVWPAEITLAE